MGPFQPVGGPPSSPPMASLLLSSWPPSWPSSWPTSWPSHGFSWSTLMQTVAWSTMTEATLSTVGSFQLLCLWVCTGVSCKFVPRRCQVPLHSAIGLLATFQTPVPWRLGWMTKMLDVGGCVNPSVPLSDEECCLFPQGVIYVEVQGRLQGILQSFVVLPECASAEAR